MIISAFDNYRPNRRIGVGGWLYDTKAGGKKGFLSRNKSSGGECGVS